MKSIILIIALIISAGAIAQDNTTVTLIASGQGKTSVEAKQFALRSAIEQAFGAFISSKTEILNDSLVRDEVTMISSGTVLDYKSLNETKLPDNSYSVTLNATVSISSLKKIAENKGEVVTFNGALFGMRLKIAKLQADAEVKVIENLCFLSKEILVKSVNFKLKVEEPKNTSLYEFIKKKGDKIDPAIFRSNQYKIRMIVECRPNENFDAFIDLFTKNILAIQMSTSELEFSKNSNIEYYNLPLQIYKNGAGFDGAIGLRSNQSIDIIKKTMKQSVQYLYQYTISSDNRFIEFSPLNLPKYELIRTYHDNINILSKFDNVLDWRFTDLKITPDLFVSIQAVLAYRYNFFDQQNYDVQFPHFYPNNSRWDDIQLYYKDYHGDDRNLVYISDYYDWSESLKEEGNWNTQFQVYDFYLPLSELEKIKEIKVEPYTKP